MNPLQNTHTTTVRRDDFAKGEIRCAGVPISRHAHLAWETLWGTREHLNRDHGSAYSNTWHTVRRDPRKAKEPAAACFVFVVSLALENDTHAPGIL